MIVVLRMLECQCTGQRTHSFTKTINCWGFWNNLNPWFFDFEILKRIWTGGSLEIEEPPKTDIYPLAHMQVETTSFGIEPWFSKNWKLKKIKLSIRWFFQENCLFCDVSEMTAASSSQILIFSQKTGTSSSLVLKILKNQNPWLFKNQIIAQHWC
jgi:hypothetical protein